MDGISKSRGWDKEIPHSVLPMEQLVLSDKWARNRFLRNSAARPPREAIGPLGPIASRRRSVQISLMTKTTTKKMMELSGSMHALSTFDHTDYSLHCLQYIQ